MAKEETISEKLDDLTLKTKTLTKEVRKIKTQKIRKAKPNHD